MNSRVALSSVFNMSLGTIPLVIAMLFCLFMPEDKAIYISAAVSLFFSLMWFFSKRVRIANYVLHISTTLLLVYSLLYIIGVLHDIDAKWIPFSLEANMILLLGVFYLFRHRIIAFLRRRTGEERSRELMQGVESTVVAVQVLFVMAIFHLMLIILAGLISFTPVGGHSKMLLYHILPPSVFILCMLFNQYGLSFFNKVMSQTKYISVVDSEGKVIGRVLKLDAPEYKNRYTNPVVRIVPICGNMLLLSQRPVDSVLDEGKIDTPMETFLGYNEKIEHGVKRLLNEYFPGVKNPETTFVVKYRLRNEETSRLIYLFTLILPEGAASRNTRFVKGKLWTLSLIEQNLNKNYFATSLEDEYELLKEVIDTREKYKVS